MLRVRALAATVLLVITAACGDESDAGPAQELYRTETLPVELTIKLDGDLKAGIDKQLVTSSYLAVSGRPDSILSVEPDAPIVANGVAFSTGFGLSPFKGDGTYTIPAGSINEPLKEGETPDPRSVRVIWSPSGDYQKDGVKYERREKPCKLVVRNNATTGTLTCSRLTGEDKGAPHFSLVMTWRVP